MQTCRFDWQKETYRSCCYCAEKVTDYSPHINYILHINCILGYIKSVALPRGKQGNQSLPSFILKHKLRPNLSPYVSNSVQSCKLFSSSISANCGPSLHEGGLTLRPIPLKYVFISLVCLWPINESLSWANLEASRFFPGTLCIVDKPPVLREANGKLTC